MSLLKVDNIHVYYGAIHAIKGISFEVNEGEIVTLIGANGAGKSTTLNTIAGPAQAPQRLHHLRGTESRWACRRTSWCPRAWRCARRGGASSS